MIQHINLDRRFWPLEPDVENDPESIRVAVAFGLKQAVSWNDLLGKSRVVILAEPGTGKTEEFQATAVRLRAEGEAAFFSRIERLQRLDIHQTFDVGSKSDFDAWSQGDEEGYFFLDSVDEARLDSRSAFQDALRNFAEALGGSLNRAKVFVSCRVSNWHATADLAMFLRYLPVPDVITVKKKVEVAEEKNEPQLGESAQDTESADHDKKKDHIVFQLMPLGEQQIRLFASHRGVANIDDFINAIERSDSMIFAERPQDLLELIGFWNSKGRLGRYAEMLEFNVRVKLKEHDSDRDQQKPFSSKDAYSGAQRIAAAATLQKKNVIILPDHPIDIELRNSSIDPKEVLPDWTSDKIQILLDRAIFDEAVYGTIRFHHRSVREYLTAKWLLLLLGKGGSRRSIERLLFADKYGHAVIIPSMTSIAAWLALWDERVRERLRKIAPEVLIQHGDPASLPVDFRRSLLIAFAELYAESKHTGVKFDITMVRRLADPHLAPTVNDLLAKFSTHDDVRSLLLKLIWQGQIVGCAVGALAFALDENLNAFTRTIAIRAVAAAGSSEQHCQLLDTLLAQSSRLDPVISSELCEAFFPHKMATAQLLKIIEAAEPPDKHSSPPLELTLENIIRRPLPDELAQEMLRGFHDLLIRPPFVDQNHCKISQRHSWLLPVAMELTNQFLQKRDPFCFDPLILDLFIVFLAGRHYLSLSSRQERLLDCAKAWPEFRFSLFWHAVPTARARLKGEASQLKAWWQVRWDIRDFWNPNVEDLERLFDSVSRPLLSDRLIALSAIFQVYTDSGRQKKLRERMKRAVAGTPELESELYELLHPKLPDEAKKWRQQERDFKRKHETREKKENENRQSWQQGLRQKAEEIKNVGNAQKAEVLQRTVYLYDRLREKKERSESHLGFSNWRALIDEFGCEVAKSFCDGCVAYWRGHDPFSYPDRRIKNSIPWPRIIGLTGLAMEAADDPGWAKRLSRHEAGIAARYSVCELNGFPIWFRQLMEAFPDIVDEVINDELRWELHSSPSSGHFTKALSAIKYSDRSVQARYKGTLLALIEEQEPDNPIVLDQALSVILAEDLDSALRETLISLAETRFRQTQDLERKYAWLITLLCLDGVSGVELLKQWLADVPTEEEKKRIVINLCAAFSDNGDPRFGRSVRDYEKLTVLRDLIPIIYRYVSVKEDVQHRGVYTPGKRDNAEQTRSRLLGIVFNTPGHLSYEMLVDLSKCADSDFLRDRMEHLAKERAALDAEFEPWQETQVAEFATSAERQPKNEAELYEIALARLDDLKIDIEDGDESEAAMLLKLTEETEVRNAFANRLKKSSRSRYTIGSEEELADSSRTDIRFNTPQVEAPVPVELKIADKWSFSELAERLENQLIGQYMKVSKHGIFLLVHNGKKSCWINPDTKRRLTFPNLVEGLREQVVGLKRKYPNIASLEVIGIDFTVRGVHNTQGNIRRHK